MIQEVVLINKHIVPCRRNGLFFPKERQLDDLGGDLAVFDLDLLSGLGVSARDVAEKPDG